MASNHQEPSYIPALNQDWLTGWYDTVIGVTMPEKHIKKALIDFASIKPGQQILDFGCGTATLTIMIKAAHPDAKVIGIAVDPKVLKIAASKIRQENADVSLQLYDGHTLPYQDHNFDRILTCFVIHHLNPKQKKQIFNELFRVLKPGGELLIADFSKPHQAVMYFISLFMRFFEEVMDHVKGRLPGMLAKAGFQVDPIVRNFSTIFGTISLIKAIKPF